MAGSVRGFVMLPVLILAWGCGDDSAPSPDGAPPGDASARRDAAPGDAGSGLDAERQADGAWEAGTDASAPEWTLEVEVSGSVVPVAGLDGRVAVRCVFRDAEGRITEPGLALSLEAPSDATDLGAGAFSFSEPGPYAFRCVARDGGGAVAAVADATVLAAAPLTPPAWARASTHAGSARMALDGLLPAFEAQDASALLGLAERLEEHRAALGRLVASETPAAYPLPYGGPTPEQWAAAGIDQTADDALLETGLQEAAQALDALRAALSALPLDADPEPADLGAVQAALQEAVQAADGLRALELSARGVVEQVPAITDFLRNHLAALQEAALTRDASMARSAAAVLALPPEARPFFSLAGLSAEISMSQAIYRTVMSFYEPALTWIAEAAFTIGLANIIDALWEADLDNGPVILAEASHGGVVDICANYPVLLMGERFDTNASRVDKGLVRLVIVSNNGVQAVEALLDLFHCRDTQKGFLENLYECLGKFDDLLEALEAVANDFNPRIDEAYSDGTYQWIRINEFPRQPSSWLPEPVFIFPFSSLTGKGPRFDATLYHCN